MTRKLAHFLLILFLVLNPLEVVFAKAMMQAHSGSGQSVLCHTQTFHSESASARLNKGVVLVDTADSSLCAVGLCQSQSPETCGDKFCGDCSHCAQGFVALNLTWATLLPSLPSSLSVPYKASLFNVDSQPDLQPPRIF